MWSRLRYGKYLEVNAITHGKCIVDYDYWMTSCTVLETAMYLDDNDDGSIYYDNGYWISMGMMAVIIMTIEADWLKDTQGNGIQ